MLGSLYQQKSFFYCRLVKEDHYSNFALLVKIHHHGRNRTAGQLDMSMSYGLLVIIAMIFMSIDRLTHLNRMDFLTIINWTGPFSSQGS